MPLLSYISTSCCLIFSSLSCSFVAYIAILDINVSLNVQLFLVVDEIHCSLQFKSIGMVKRFWIVGLWYEFLSWVPYVIDIWSRCIKMVPSKFDVFMYLFCFVLVFYAFFSHTTSSVQNIQTSTSGLARWHRGKDETVPLLDLICFWVYCRGSVMLFVNQGTDVLYYYVLCQTSLRIMTINH